MNLGSTSKNINILTIGIAVISILGLLNPSMFTLTNVLITLASFYLLNIVGIYMMLHRFFSHKAFAFSNKYTEYFFTLISLLAGRGSPLGWVYVHRQHHAYSDTDKDPHSPKFLDYKLFGFSHYKKQEEDKMQIFTVKDLMTKEHLFIHKWYIAILLSFILVLSLISIETLYFAWILPAFLVHLSQNNFNYFGHMSGYRNFETKDDSRNNIWLFPFLLGEAWHNNHHHDPKNFTTKKKSHEFDPVVSIINMVKKQ